jgi:hypothetical protein
LASDELNLRINDAHKHKKLILAEELINCLNPCSNIQIMSNASWIICDILNNWETKVHGKELKIYFTSETVIQ